MIVFMDPGLVGRCAGVVGKVGVGVCPFLFEGAVESFDFAVDLLSVAARRIRALASTIQTAVQPADRVVCPLNR